MGKSKQENKYKTTSAESGTFNLLLMIYIAISTTDNL